jgi:hypothetical protein
MKLVWEAKRRRSEDDFMEESKLKRGWKVAQGVSRAQGCMERQTKRPDFGGECYNSVMFLDH